MRRFNGWCASNGEDGNELSKRIRHYIDYLAKHKSGRNVETTTRIIMSILKEELRKEERDELSVYMRVSKRIANQQHPPASKASVAVRYREVLELLERASRVRISLKESQALDIFVVCFCTMSRAHEISELKVSDVAEDGSHIRIRPKTKAKDWEYFTKCIRDCVGLHPSAILKRRRREAQLMGYNYLFNRGGEDSPIKTEEVSKVLGVLAKKLGIGKKVSAHSARKGAAVDMLLLGIPVVIIKAWGTWARLDTLENYVGRAVREEISPSDFMNAAAQV